MNYVVDITMTTTTMKSLILISLISLCTAYNCTSYVRTISSIETDEFVKNCAKRVVVPVWSGNAQTCTPVTRDEAFINATSARINYHRSFVGVLHVVEDIANSIKCDLVI
jgi:hypothetical protein